MVANWKSDVGYAWWLMENFWVTIAETFGTNDRQCTVAYPLVQTIPAAIRNSSMATVELNFKDRSLQNLLKIWLFLRNRNVGYVYLSDYPSTSFFYLILRLFGIRRIVVHDHTPGERSPPSRPKLLLKRTINKLPLINADNIIAVTEFVRRRHIEVAQIPVHKCAVAANGIHPLDLSAAKRDYAQEQFSIPADRLIVITTGRATYYKGIDFFIECADRLINHLNQRNFHFLYCGDGPAMADFRKLVSQKQLAEHFTFAGNRADVRDILPSCHIGLHAAEGEVGYSLSILEYMSAGLLTIVPDGPSTSLATTHLVNGLIYPPRNIEKACDAIQLALNEEESTKIRKRAIEDVLSRFHISNTNDALVRILTPIFSVNPATAISSTQDRY